MGVWKSIRKRWDLDGSGVAFEVKNRLGGEVLEN